MKMVYTSENRFIVGNAKNILESHNIEAIFKNEHTSSLVGEVGAFDAWVELWVLDDSDYDRAVTILENSLNNILSDKDATDWLCHYCGEKNPSTFQRCWNCLKEKE